LLMHVEAHESWIPSGKLTVCELEYGHWNSWFTNEAWWFSHQFFVNVYQTRGKSRPGSSNRNIDCWSSLLFFWPRPTFSCPVSQKSQRLFDPFHIASILMLVVVGHPLYWWLVPNCWIVPSGYD
jgi:hypothetical protein